MEEQFKPKRPKYGGRQKGAKNKATIARQQAIEEALRTIKNANGSGVFDGDAHALLMLVYKNESFPLDVRTKAAEAALKFEKPALAAVDLKGTVDHTFVVHMPEPIQGVTSVERLENWKKIYCENEPIPNPEADARWERQLSIAKAAADKNGGEE